LGPNIGEESLNPKKNKDASGVKNKPLKAMPREITWMGNTEGPSIKKKQLHIKKNDDGIPNSTFGKEEGSGGTSKGGESQRSDWSWATSMALMGRVKH